MLRNARGLIYHSQVDLSKQGYGESELTKDAEGQSEATEDASPWVIRNMVMCLHCRHVMSPHQQYCTLCDCRICGVRQAKIFMRLNSETPMAKKYAIYQEPEDDSFWAAEWHESGLRKFRCVEDYSWKPLSPSDCCERKYCASHLFSKSVCSS